MSADLTLNRLALELQVSARQADTGKALCQEVARALPALLASRLDLEDEGPVLLIRRMTIELSHAAGGGAEALAARLAEAIARGIAKVRSARAGAIQFPSRAAFAAAYLRARQDGTASGRWWFRSFEGLSALTESATLRTLLGRDWNSALDVLAACDDGTLARLWLALDPRDASAILAGIAGAGVVNEGAAAEPDKAEWAEIAGLLLAALGDGLSPEVAILAAAGALAGQDRGRAARACAVAAAQLQPVLALLAVQGRPVGTRRRRDAEVSQWAVLARTQGLPETLVGALGDRLDPAASEAGVRLDAKWRASEWLGYAMLWPFATKDLSPDIDDWPPPEGGVCGADLLQLLILSTCSGGQDLLCDGAWRDLFGLPGPYSPRQIGNWAVRAGPARWATLAAGEAEAAALAVELVPLAEARQALARCAGLVLRRFACALPGFADSSAEFLRQNLLGSGGVARFDAKAVHVKLRRPPLDVLLGMTGLGDRTFELPGGRVLTLERAR